MNDVYKIVYVTDDGQHVSFSAQFFKSWVPEFGLEYKLGERTVPKYGCGPLAAFDGLDSLQEFLKCFVGERQGFDYSRFVVYRCECARSSEFSVWYRHQDKGNFMSQSKFEPGTVLCDWIKPVEIIPAEVWAG